MSTPNFVYGQCAGVFQGQNDIIWDVALHNDLILYSGSDSGRLVAWNAQTCQMIGSMQCQGTVTQVRALRRILVSAGDRVVVTEVLPSGMFSPVQFATVPVLNPLVPRGAPGCIIGTVCMVVDDEFLYVGYVDGFVRLWAQGKLAREFRVHAGVVMTICKEGDSVFTGGQDQAVFSLDVRDGRTTSLYRGTHGPIRAVCTYGNKLAVATGNAIRVQTIDNGELLQRLCGHTLPIFSMIRDRNLLYSGSGDRKVFVWNLDTLWPIMEINTGHQGRVKSMCLSSQGMLFTGSSDRLIRKFDMRDAFGRYEAYAQQNNISPRPVINGSGGGGGGGAGGSSGARLQRSHSSGAHHGANGGAGGGQFGGSLNHKPGMSTIDLADMLPALPGSSAASPPPQQQQQQPPPQPMSSPPPPKPANLPPPNRAPPAAAPPPARQPPQPQPQRSFQTMPNVKTVLVPVYSVNQPNESARAATMPPSTLRQMQQQQPPPQQFGGGPPPPPQQQFGGGPPPPQQFGGGGAPPPGPPPFGGAPSGPPPGPPPHQNVIGGGLFGGPPPSQMPPGPPPGPPPARQMFSPPMSPPMSPAPQFGGGGPPPFNSPPPPPPIKRAMSFQAASQRELPSMPDAPAPDNAGLDFDALDDERSYGNLGMTRAEQQIQIDAMPANFPGYRALPAVPGIGGGPPGLDGGEQASYASLPAHAANGRMW